MRAKWETVVSESGRMGAAGILESSISNDLSIPLGESSRCVMMLTIWRPKGQEILLTK